MLRVSEKNKEKRSKRFFILIFLYGYFRKSHLVEEQEPDFLNMDLIESRKKRPKPRYPALLDLTDAVIFFLI